MLSIRWRAAITIVLLVGSASACHGQVQLAQILLLDYNQAQQLAKTRGLPLMVVVLAKGDRPSGPLLDSDVVRRSRAFLNVAVLAGETVSRKLNSGPPGSVLFLDGGGKILARLDPGCGVEQLQETMASIAEGARTRALERINNGPGPLVALESYVQLAASVADLIPLLANKNPGVSSKVRKVLATRKEEGADWALLKAMSSPDAEFRAACYPAAMEVVPAPKVPPVGFWKQRPPEERDAALEEWREAVYGKLPALNKAILDFAFKNYGKKVEDGLCGQLVVRALQEAGGQLPKNETTWGQRLPPAETALPGDIVILEKARFRGRALPGFRGLSRSDRPPRTGPGPL